MDRFRGFDVNNLRQQMDDLLNDLFGPAPGRKGASGTGEQERSQAMPLNVVETEDDVTIVTPLPGAGPECVEVSIRGQMVMIRGRRSDVFPDGTHYYRREWGYGPFHRNFELPMPIDPERAQATVHRGVLRLTIAKASAASSVDTSVETTPEVETTETETVETTVPVDAEPVQLEIITTEPVEEPAPEETVEPAGEAPASEDAPTDETAETEPARKPRATRTPRRRARY